MENNVKCPALTSKEFYTKACRYADSTSTETAKKWWRAFNEVFVHELYHNHTCRLPDVGTFDVRVVEESIQRQVAPGGELMVYRVPERIVPTFTPHDTFINDVNYAIVTKAGRKREKRDVVTKRDQDRKCRAEADGVSDIPMTPEEIELSKARFASILKNKVNRKVEEKIGKEE